MRTLKEHRCFGGTQGFYVHASTATGTDMRLSVFVPPQGSTERLAVLYFLSGLTCTEENFTTKAGAQRYAAQHGLILVAPDTSPRGAGLEGEGASWDFGLGAGFYVDATIEPWARHYAMYSYVTRELPALIAERFPADPTRQGITGHSMGGHGALVCALRNPEVFRSVSAFSPISAPMRCPWGEKAFTGYLGADRDTWRKYDATELLAHARWRRPILVDQGTSDEFLETQLRPTLLTEAAAAHGVDLRLRMQQGYDHSYYFIASFIADHLAFHATELRA
jgi:S-formylglutathione hydrolase